MKWFFASIGMAIGISVAILTHNYYEFVDRIKAFESKCARFTADHGQELCLRIRALESAPKPCEYSQK